MYRNFAVEALGPHVRIVPLLLAGTILIDHSAPGPSPGRVAFEGAVEEAGQLFKSGKTEEAAARLEEHLRFSVGDADTLDLYGQVLAKLGRNDEAAHAYDQALAGLPEKDRRISSIEKRLQKVDPLARRREGVLEKIVDRMLESAEKLHKGDYDERALTILERLTPIATGKDREQIVALVAEIRAATTEVDLAADAEGERPDRGWPLYEHESEHYKFECNLEPEVTERLGDVMDDIFAYYVQIYFDGKPSSGRKATVRVHATHDDMLEEWTQDGAPLGWWSSGEWKVYCFDSRPGEGSLDGMLRTLFHEASHQFMSMLGDTPSWLNEGTASFFEGATAMEDRRVLWPDAAAQRLQSLNAMLTGMGEGPTFLDVISYDQRSSYDAAYYPWGWGLVYFLQQFEDPETLEYVYRPLYIEYREEALKRWDQPRQIFEKVLLGENSPLGHQTLEDFERDWKAWIRDEVYMQYYGQARRKMRMERLEDYMKAADKAAGKRKAVVSEEDLLLRALGHVEFVRTSIDDPQRPDPELLLTQADVLERLDRPGSAAPLLEQVLGMASAGEFDLSEKEVAALEERLADLDAKNAPLRTARARAKGLSVTAQHLLSAYQDADESLLLRSYAFAKLAGAVLDDQEVLLPEARRLRELASEKGLLRGAIYRMTSADGDWRTIFNNQEDVFEVSPERVVIEGVRPVGKICTAVPIRGEYELRARFLREGKVRRSSFHGVVFSGTAGGDWMVIGINGLNGTLMMKRILFAGGAVSDVALTSRRPIPPVRSDEVIELAVHVLPDGHTEVRLGDRDPVTFQMPLAVPAVGHVGVYVKDGRNVLENLVVEILP